MPYKDKDKQFQSEIRDVLITRWVINANKEAQTLRIFGDLDDKINPSLTLTLDEIKTKTGREKARPDPILSDYQNALQNSHIEVERQHDRLIINVRPQRDKSNEFGSVRDLTKKNETDLENDPDLGEAPWD